MDAQTYAPDIEIDENSLTELVRKALDRPGLQLANWKATPLHGGFEWDSAVFRIQGEAWDGGESLPWSLILKAVRPAKKALDPGGIWYWKREACAYQCGLLHRLPGGNLNAPVCYEVCERLDGSLWLWLEDMKDDIASPWSLEQYAQVARHLGQFNGGYLTGQPFPSEPWVTRNWLRKYVENAGPMIEFIHRNPDHPVVSHMLPDIVMAELLAVWDERQRILDMLESLPQVFCHQDAFRRNLFTRGGRTFAIDWGYMGIAPVGTELVALVGASLGFFEIPADQAMELDRLCFDGYLQGLRDAGWNGDPRQVRTGYAVSLMFRYPIGGQVGELLPVFLDQVKRSKMETVIENKSPDDLERVDPAMLAYYQKMLPEAMKLLGMKGLLRLVSRIGVYALRSRVGKKHLGR